MSALDEEALPTSVYLNHAGTSWPKPGVVRSAVAGTWETPAEDWAGDFKADHSAVARWLGVRDPQRLLLTPGCTSALAVAVADLPWSAGDRVLCSSFEHQALARPLSTLTRDHGVEVVAIPPSKTSSFDLDVFEGELMRGAKLVALAWAGNITGELVPAEAIIERAHAHGALVLLDAAQVAGWLAIDVGSLGVDLLAFAGHKGPQAPWGIGGLYVAPHVQMRCAGAVCSIEEGAAMPSYCDTGSVDRAALAGLAAGIEWLEERPERLREGRAAIARLRRAIPAERVVFYGPEAERRMPTLALTHKDIDVSTLAASLRARGVIAAAGSMCAPQALETLGAPGGVLRLSVGPATRDEDLARAERVLSEAF
ncbi:MAG: aminotransferase class V-fold PLP-dependent enzyme [Polyangiales bacterium]